MNITRVKAIARKEFIQIIRDPRSLGMAIAIPMLLLILFGYALTLDVDNIPMIIWNQDRSAPSRDFIRNFQDSHYFAILSYVDNYADLQNDIDKGKALMGMVIPENFSDLLRSGRSTPVQLIVDGSNSNTATIGLGYVSAVVLTYNKKILLETLDQSASDDLLPIDARARVWFNPDLESKNFIIPGLIAVIMMVISALLTSLTVAREWERGTMEQLISTPISSQELILGKFIPYFIIGFIDVIIAVAMGQFIFHVPLRGSVILLFLMSGFFLAGSLSFGIFISIIAKNQLLASQIAIIATFLPSFLLSGFMYSLSNMPPIIQAITHIIPARYFITILKGIYLKGVGFNVLVWQMLFLFIFCCVAVLLANIKFKKKVA